MAHSKRPAWEAIVQKRLYDVVWDGVSEQQQLLLDGLHRHTQRRYMRPHIWRPHSRSKAAYTLGLCLMPTSPEMLLSDW